MSNVLFVTIYEIDPFSENKKLKFSHVQQFAEQEPGRPRIWMQNSHPVLCYSVFQSLKPGKE